MGTFDYIILEEGVTLPYFPDELDHTEIDWQTKDLSSTMNTFKITESGRLLRKTAEKREKTPEEKRKEAKEHGFNSWDEYYNAWKNKEGHDFSDNSIPLIVHTEKVVDKYWVDYEMHGSFEFHGSISDPDFYFSYEARFTEGELSEIIFLRNRMSEESREESINRLKELDLNLAN